MHPCATCPPGLRLISLQSCANATMCNLQPCAMQSFATYSMKHVHVLNHSSQHLYLHHAPCTSTCTCAQLQHHLSTISLPPWHSAVQTINPATLRMHPCATCPRGLRLISLQPCANLTMCNLQPCAMQPCATYSMKHVHVINHSYQHLYLHHAPCTRICTCAQLQHHISST